MTSYEEAVKKRGPMGNWKRIAFLVLCLVVLFGFGTLYLVIRYWPQLTAQAGGQNESLFRESRAQEVELLKDGRIKEIVNQSLTAMGGPQKFEDLEDMVQKGYMIVQTPAGEVRVKRTLYTTADPPMLRLEQKVAGQQTIIGFDGKNGWLKKNGEEVEIPPAILESLKREMKRNQLLLELEKHGSQAEYLGSQELWDNQEAHKILFEDSEGRQTLIFIDTQTQYLRAYEFADPDQGGTLEYRLDDYRRVGEYAFPFRITTYQSGQKREEIIIEQLRINAGLDSELFRPGEKNNQK
jgi:hypothetical protein